MTTEDAAAKPAGPEPEPAGPRPPRGRVPILLLKPFPPSFLEKWKVPPQTPEEKEQQYAELKAYFLEILGPEGIVKLPNGEYGVKAKTPEGRRAQGYDE